MYSMKFLKNRNIILVVAFACLLAACDKETSYEKGANVFGKSLGTLKDSLGNCQSIVVKGKVNADTVFTDSNYLIVKVNITTSGQYKIFSDTVNGIWFLDTGYVAAGTQTLKIRGYGKPILPINANFILSYNNSICLFTCSLTTAAPVLPIIRDYFPTTIGSNWAYDVAGFTDTLHVSASNKDTTIAGNAHRIFYSFRGASFKDTGYYRKDVNDYYRWDKLDGNSASVALLYLKESNPILTQWNSNVVNTIVSGLPTQARMHYTLLAVNTTRTVNGNAFDSVIQVKNELQYMVLGNFQTAQSFDTYFAKNIGLIEFNIPGLYLQTIKRWKVY